MRVSDQQQRIADAVRVLTDSAPPLTPERRRVLRDIFAPYVERLTERRGRDSAGRFVAKRKLPPIAANRFYESRFPIFTVTGGYAYFWDGDQALDVGDRVLLPGGYPPWKSWEALIIERGTTYGGPLSGILAKVDDGEI